MKRIVLFAIICFFAVVTPAKADDYKDALRVYKEYLAGTIKKDLGLVMSRLDTTSPTYQAEVKGVAEAMINTDMNFKIVSADLIGQNGDIIVLRVVQKNLPKTENPNAKGVEVDALQILRKDVDGNWKFRNSQILSIKQIDNE